MSAVDLNRKKMAYQEFGTHSYGIFDPDPREPSLTAFERRDGQYATLAKVTGLQRLEAERPFPVEVIPARLLAGLP